MDKASVMESASAVFPKKKERPAEKSSMSINGSLSCVEKAWRMGRRMEVV